MLGYLWMTKDTTPANLLNEVAHCVIFIFTLWKNKAVFSLTSLGFSLTFQWNLQTILQPEFQKSGQWDPLECRVFHFNEKATSIVTMHLLEIKLFFNIVNWTLRTSMRNQQVYLTIYSFRAVIYKAKIEPCIQKFPENSALATE